MDRPLSAVRRVARRSARGRAQRPRSDGAGHRRRAGQPSVRMVLLKGHGPDGFAVLHQRAEPKGDELADKSARGAAVPLEVAAPPGPRRGRGRARVTDAEADAYFATRARDSQLGAWASDQSRPLDSRATFEAALRGNEAAVRGEDVPRPPHWRGYRVMPERIEFWTDRPHRLHERRLFTLRWRRLERRAALPMTTASTAAEHSAISTRAALASVAIALDPARRQGLGGLRRPIRRRCWGRSPTRRST